MHFPPRHSALRAVRFFGRAAAALGFVASSLAAQDNTLDLRVLELNDKGKVTYQNFIYSRMFDSGRFIMQALYLRIPTPGLSTYNEFSAGAGVRAFSSGELSTYVLGSLASATDAKYFEPAILALDTQGKWQGSFYLQRYVPLSSDGVGQWLIDPLEVSYAIAAPLSVGTSIYGYRADGGTWLTKLGVKLGLADSKGATEFRVSAVRQGDASAGQEFQLRRIFVF